ncbi:hypothetical protein ACQJBY_011621 [Aegilops geniculata]
MLAGEKHQAGVLRVPRDRLQLPSWAEAEGRGGVHSHDSIHAILAVADLTVVVAIRGFHRRVDRTLRQRSPPSPSCVFSAAHLHTRRDGTALFKRWSRPSPRRPPWPRLF